MEFYLKERKEMFWIKFDLTIGILVNNKSEHDWFICSIHSTLNQANSL